MIDERRGRSTLSSLSWLTNGPEKSLNQQIGLGKLTITSKRLLLRPTSDRIDIKPKGLLGSGSETATFAEALAQRLSKLATLSEDSSLPATPSPPGDKPSRSSGVCSCSLTQSDVEDDEFSDELSAGSEGEESLEEGDWESIKGGSCGDAEAIRPVSGPLKSFTQYRLKLLSKEEPSPGEFRSASSISSYRSGCSERKLPSPALTNSYFPNCKPTIHFAVEGEPVTRLPMSVQKLLKWRMSSVTPNIIKDCLTRSGFSATKKNDDWLGCWGKHMKSTAFRSVMNFQKINHFPGTFEIGRKDRLWRNLVRMQARHGKKEYDFFPQTYVLPNDSVALKQEFDRLAGKQKWIIKPPASARGIGIRVVHKWSQIPKRKPVIVQKYLDRPFLVNGSKFDLRVYVYVSSFDPLRIYVFQDGLTRFATCKYSAAAKSLSNRFIHLTNYSVNKKNDAFVPNSDETVCQGHKWGLKAFWGYLRSTGIDVDGLWESIKDIIVKTIISGESAVNSLMNAHVKRKWSCHELFGFDIMLDRNLKPWVLEVNISPSLHSTSRLDRNIKGQMVRDILNMAGFGLPPAATLLKGYSDCVPSRTYYPLESHERAKHIFYQQKHTDSTTQSTILNVLTPDDVRILIEAEDEFSRRGQFERVFPTETTMKYLSFLEIPRYYNILLEEWTRHCHFLPGRGTERLISCAKKSVHLQTVASPDHQWNSSLSESLPAKRRASSAPGSTVQPITRSRPKSSLASKRKNATFDFKEIRRLPPPRREQDAEAKGCTPMASWTKGKVGAGQRR
eukprot:m.7589 g.7589  ORF g.7589 m.7589 type:complete len:786 (+) comp19114_c0_seq1:73-2430(+)